MNYSRYFCNLYQAYLMATNTFRISDTIARIYKGDKEYNEPGREELNFLLNEQSKTRMAIRINTNYIKLHPHSLKDIYYHAFEIDAVYYYEKRYTPLYSIVKESEDGKALLITRGIYL